MQDYQRQWPEPPDFGRGWSGGLELQGFLKADAHPLGPIVNPQTVQGQLPRIQRKTDAERFVQAERTLVCQCGRCSDCRLNARFATLRLAERR